LPDEILELPPVFHPSRANEFSEFSEKRSKTLFLGKITDFFKQVFPENPAESLI
jgi:hypothetical protein